MTKKIMLVLGAALVAVVAVAALAGATPRSHARAHTAQLAPAASPSAIAQSRAAIRGKFGALRRARRAEDALPEAVAQSPLLADGVADVADSRAVRGAGAGAWIAPEADATGTCLVRPGTLNCVPDDYLTAHGASPGFSFNPDGYTVSGMASDAVTSVTVSFANAPQQVVAVANNAFVITSTARPTGVSWTGPNGPEEVAAPALNADAPQSPAAP